MEQSDIPVFIGIGNDNQPVTTKITSINFARLLTFHLPFLFHAKAGCHVAFLLFAFLPLPTSFQHLKSRPPVDLMFIFGAAGAGTGISRLGFAITDGGEARSFYSFRNQIIDGTFCPALR